MPANVRATQIALSRKKEVTLNTPSAVSADYSTLSKTNAALADVNLVTETDAADIGKGHEFAENVYPLNWDCNVSFDKYLTSLGAAMAFAFGLGKVVKTAPDAGALQYVCTPLTSADGINLPSLAYLEANGAVFNRQLAGMVVNTFGLELNSGPGRQNSKLTMNLVGTGKFTNPNTVTFPAAAVEVGLPAGAATITIIGVNYVSLKTFINFKWTWNNNPRLDSGFYPGSGVSNGGQTRGRMEHGDRTVAMEFQARFEVGSSELTKLQAQTEGTIVVSIVGPLIAGASNHSLNLTMHRVTLSQAKIADDNGIVTIQCNAEAKYDAVNGLVTATVITNVDGIMQ